MSSHRKDSRCRGAEDLCPPRFSDQRHADGEGAREARDHAQARVGALHDVQAHDGADEQARGEDGADHGDDGRDGPLGDVCGLTICGADLEANSLTS